MNHASSQNRLRPKVPNGVPNFGNTCFLNSILQQLYMLRPVRSFLKNQKSYRNPMLQYLRDVFYLMGQDKQSLDIKQMRSTIQKLLQILQERLYGYRIGAQSDSLQAFLLFFNQMNEFQPSFSSHFEASQLIRCKCNNQRQISIQDYVVQNSFGCCSTCLCTIQRSFSISPDYLIIKGQSSDIAIKQIQVDQNSYILQSANIYTGDGNSGHYTAFCNYEEQGLFQFNDSRVSPSQFIINKNSRPVFFIYQKQKDTPYNFRRRKISIKYPLKKEDLKQRFKKFSKSGFTILCLVIGFIFFSLYEIGISLLEKFLKYASSRK